MTWIGQQRVQDTPGPARRIPGESVAWVYGSKLTRNARSLSGGAPRDIAERESKVGAGARSIEPFQVSGWRGARKAASYGLSIVLFS